MGEFGYAAGRGMRDWLLALAGSDVDEFAPSNPSVDDQLEAKVGTMSNRKRMGALMSFYPPSAAGPELDEDLERRILQRTWGRIHQLRVERQADQVIVRGYCPSYYIKQLALLAVQEMGESIPIRFEIQVGESARRPSEGNDEFPRTNDQRMTNDQ